MAGTTSASGVKKVCKRTKRENWKKRETFLTECKKQPRKISVVFLMVVFVVVVFTVIVFVVIVFVVIDFVVLVVVVIVFDVVVLFVVVVQEYTNISMQKLCLI